MKLFAGKLFCYMVSFFRTECRIGIRNDRIFFISIKNHSQSVHHSFHLFLQNVLKLKCQITWNSSNNLIYCFRYPDYREPPGSPEQYEKSSIYWEILAAKLAFVVIFENVVVLVMIIVKWCIPDVPAELRDEIRREAYITNEIIIQQEGYRAQSGESRKYSFH